MRHCTVVIVDDTADIRFLIRMALTRHSDVHVVGEGTDGQEAVDLCAEHKPDVVVLDISMPIMDGLQALPLICEVSPATNVVMLSGFTTDEIKAKAFEMGARTFVEKGMAVDHIVAAVTEQCCPPALETE